MKLINVFYLLLLFSLSSCALSEGFSPPPDGKTVKVAVVKPADIDILPMDIIYRSEKCRDKILTSAGAISSRAGYHLLTVPFKPEAGSDIVSNSVALDGGGQCQWKISNIRFQFQFSDMKKFGVDIKENIPNDVVFVFDKNAPSRGNGKYENVSGDIRIRKDYYPLINKRFTGNGMSVLTMQGQPLLTYKVYQTNKIVFEPVIHLDLLVYALPPNENNNDYVVIFPNGERETDRWFPNSEKTKYKYVRNKAKGKVSN